MSHIFFRRWYIVLPLCALALIAGAHLLNRIPGLNVTPITQPLDGTSETDVTFRYSTPTGDAKTIFDTYYARGYVSGQVNAENWGYSYLDIDNDGMMDVLVYDAAPINCGSRGCTFAIYKRSGDNEWKPVLFSSAPFVITFTGIRILSSHSGSYQDIALPDGFGGYATWRWNGQAYDKKK